MTVAELIEKLRQLDQDLPVMTPGFEEGGVEPVAEPKVVKIAMYRLTELAEPMLYADFFSHDRVDEIGQPWDAVVIDFDQEAQHRS